MNAAYNDYQTILSKETSDAITEVVNGAASRRVPGIENSTENMRDARAEEKERVSVQNSFAQRYGLGQNADETLPAEALPLSDSGKPLTTTEKLSFDEQKELSEAAALDYLFEDD